MQHLTKLNTLHYTRVKNSLHGLIYIDKVQVTQSP